MQPGASRPPVQEVTVDIAYPLAAAWMGLALLASHISIRLGSSVDPMGITGRAAPRLDGPTPGALFGGST